jgi:hypothetical protein
MTEEHIDLADTLGAAGILAAFEEAQRLPEGSYERVMREAALTGAALVIWLRQMVWDCRQATGIDA